MENHEKVLEGIQADITPIVKKSAEVSEILTPESEARAVEFIAQVKRSLKLVDEMRKVLVKPIRDALDNVNQRFSAILKPLEEAETTVKASLSQYRQSGTFLALQKQAEETEQKAREAIASGDIAAMEQLADEQALARSQTGTVQTTSGSVHYRTNKQWRISNLDLVHRNFLIPDEKAIKEAIKQNLTIPGVEVWEEKVPILRT